MKEKDNSSNLIKKEKKKNKNSPNILIEEKDNFNKQILTYSKIKKIKKDKKEIFPLISLKNPNISEKNVKEENDTQSSKSSGKNFSLKINKKNSLNNNNNIRYITDLNKEKDLILDNNDSFYFENKNDYNNIINDSKIINSNTINNHFNKTSKNKINKRKNENNESENLNDVFKQLLNIKHKIRDINVQKKNKIYQFNTNLSNTLNSANKYNFKLNNQKYNHTISNYYTHNHNNISYNKNYSTLALNSKTLKNKRGTKRIQSLKPNINIVNFKKSSNSYRRFNEHIKYILHIRENEMNALANQFQKALEENEKEKDFHYKNRIFPLEIIEKLIKIKDDLTLSKYRNEYFKRVDRYDIHPLRKILDNEKKNVKANKVKIFKGIFSKMYNIK